MFLLSCFLLGLAACLATDSRTCPTDFDFASSFLQLQANARRANATSSLQTSLEQHLARAQSFCEDNLWLTLKTCVQPLDDETTYVVTGDIDAMWIRDSSAQMHPYIAIAKREEQENGQSKLRPLLEGTLRRQAQFMLTDPYANAFTTDWDSVADDRLGRGAYVFTDNYELDSGAYFFKFLARLSDAFPDTAVLHEQPVKDATRMLIALYRQEQKHAAGQSEYRYPKWEPFELLGDDGRGLPVAETGMVWGAFRPSDDRQSYGYNVPGNIFLAATLKPIRRIARQIWKDPELAHAAWELRDSIIKGVRKYGTTRRADGEVIYCYEVDGLGACSVEDDANVPSLLSLPYLDPSAETFNHRIYKATRKIILSDENPWFFQGRAGHGIGSMHTGSRAIWPLSLVMQAMTAESDVERHAVFETLTKAGMLSNTRGLTESFDADEPGEVTRPWFGWPNSLLAEHLLSQDRCQPPLSFLDQLFNDMTGPLQTRPAPRLPEWKEEDTFYGVDPARLRRKDVTLPKLDFYP